MANADHAFIRQAIAMADTSAHSGGDPFGALLVYQGKVVVSSIDKSIAYSDPTAHAELILISEYCRSNQLISLEGHTLYCNTEPCMMCCGAIHWARISRVVFSVSQKMLQTFSGGKPKSSSQSLLNADRQRVEIVGPVLPEEGLRIYQTHSFVSKKDRHKQFWQHD
ncbi:MAG: nucleoside deaminase [Bacteroidota bacterium]